MNVSNVGGFNSAAERRSVILFEIDEAYLVVGGTTRHPSMGSRKHARINVGAAGTRDRPFFSILLCAMQRRLFHLAPELPLANDRCVDQNDRSASIAH